MLKKIISVVVSGCLLATFAASAEDAASGFTAAQQAEIGKIAADYLVAHPEVLVQASQKLQEQQQAEQQQTMLKQVLQNQKSLLDDKSTPTVGPADAKVAVIEFFDYQCVYCSHLAPELEATMKSNPGVRYIFKDWPIFAQRWTNSLTAAERGLAVWQQKGPAAYIAYHNAVYNTGHFEGALTTKDIDSATRAAGAPVSIKAKNAEEIFTTNSELAQAIGLTGTPGLIVMPVSGANPQNTTVLPGAVPAEELQSAITRAMHP